MIYKQFKDKKLSTLGLGCMRLPQAGEGPAAPIDEKKAVELIEHAYHSGINYFDNAYGYHGGESERIVGKVLNQFPRDTWYLASKMPGHMMTYKDGKLGFIGYMSGSKIDGISQIFEDQLEKCRVDYFDFYLLHNVCESSYDFYTNEELGVIDYLLEQKRAGRIKHLGFSSHGRAETIDKFLNTYDFFEFVMIQINYLDWVLQDAKSKYEVITRHGIPVLAMEPCRGGALASLDPGAGAILRKSRPNDPDAHWAFRFLQSLPNMQVVLSGMSTLEQLKDNIALFSKPDPVTEEEKALLMEAVNAMAEIVPCTSCRYCCDDCPQHLDIPLLISLFNEASYGMSFILGMTLGALTDNELPSACIGCGNCTQMCPQQIDIPGVMRKFEDLLKNQVAAR
jgi:predicted aldo/keto reductase-like oxidoreductase